MNDLTIHQVNPSETRTAAVEPIGPSVDLELPLGRIQVIFEALTPVSLPDFGGSTLRGCLGHGLRALACVMSAGHPCSACTLRTRCRYAELFEPLPPAKLADRYPDVPPPWVLEPQWVGALSLRPGEHFATRINLFGPALEKLPDLLRGLELGVQRGIGKGHGRARICRVELEDENGWTPLVLKGRWVVASVRRFSKGCVPDEAELELELEILTPARLVAMGRVQGPDGWSAPLLLNALWRRVKLYDACYLGNRLPMERPDPGSAELKGRLQVTRWQRYSNRQRRPVRMDGVTGSLLLKNLPAVWLPLFELGQWTHLGKNTGFGLGQYRIVGVSR